MEEQVKSWTEQIRLPATLSRELSYAHGLLRISGGIFQRSSGSENFWTKMPESQKHEIKSRGLRVLVSGHPAIRKLRRQHSPSLHGSTVWDSTWLMIDFIKKMGLPIRTSVMEVGCGWGLAGIFCARQYEADVVGVDCDSEVFPYLRLQAMINRVSLHTMRRSFENIKRKDLMGVEYLIGSDICFRDSLVNPLKSMIRRALRSGVKMVILADPGRPPFEALASHFIPDGSGTLSDWHIRHPGRISGRILKVRSPG